MSKIANVSDISIHIRNILSECELNSDSTVKKYLTVQTENKRQVHRIVSLYRLDMILAIGKSLPLEGNSYENRA